VTVLEIIKIIFLGPVNDMKKTPGTSLSVLFLWGFVAYVGLVVYPKLAAASDVVIAKADAESFKKTAEKIQASVSSLDNRLKYDGMRRDLEQVDGEISAIDREITRLARAGGEPTDFLLDRQQRLVSRRADITRSITALIQQHPELVSQ
jgi:hypothetical protein